MAVFERDRASRRLWSLSTDPFLAPTGGMPSGSITTYTDTGERFIYDGDSRVWLPLIGEEDLLSVLMDIRDGIGDLIADSRITRAAVATMANDQSCGNFPTDYD